MITIFPIEDKTSFERAQAELNKTVDVILEAKDGETVLGRIGFTVDRAALHITGLSLSEDFIADGLIKAAISYAMQREIPTVTAEGTGVEPSLLAIGFVKKGTMLFLCLDTFTSDCRH